MSCVVLVSGQVLRVYGCDNIWVPVQGVVGPVDDAPRALVHILLQSLIRMKYVNSAIMDATFEFRYFIPRWKPLHSTGPGLVSPCKYRLQAVKEHTYGHATFLSPI